MDGNGTTKDERKYLRFEPLRNCPIGTVLVTKNLVQTFELLRV